MRKFLLIVASLCNSVFSQGIDLKCSLGTASWSFASGTLCSPSGLTISSENQLIISVNGKNTTENVKILSFSSQTINFVPKGLGILFPQLEAFQIYNSKLQELKKEDLAQLGKLKQLYLHYNELEYLPFDLFEDNTELIFIYFSSNKLKFVGENILAPLKKLQLAYFSSNSCINMDATSQSAIPGLIQALISQCSVPKYCKATQSQLEENKKLQSDLNAANTKLKNCDGNFNSATKNLLNVFKNLKTCAKPNSGNNESEKLNLICKMPNDKICEASELLVKFSGSQINKAVYENGTLLAKSIEKLRINDQQTLFLPSNLADYFPILIEFTISNSGLFFFDDRTFENLTTLTTLTITGNKIIEVAAKSFINLVNLLKLNLSFNRIEAIDDEAFNGIVKLQELQLNDNFLTATNGKIFASLKSLKVLQLQNNKIKFIASTLPSQLNELSLLDLTNNLCINMKFPNDTKAKIENEIVNNCNEPIELKCSFEDDPVNVSDSKQISGKMCKAYEFFVEYPKKKISGIKGTGSKVFDSVDVTAFIAVKQAMKFLPMEFSKNFPNLVTIWIQNSQLKSLNKKDFSGFNKLTEIVITSNNLSSIDAEIFNDVPQLEILELSDDKIASLPSNIFVNLLKLKTLILSNNQIVKLTADLFPFKNGIVEFRADNNNLETIDHVLMKYLKKAQIIDFSANDCIDLKYDKSSKEGTPIILLFGTIYFSCVPDPSS